MGTVSVTNTTSGLSSKTIAILESIATITGAWNFSRGASAPFEVNSGAAKVDNLNADKVDGVDIGTIATNRIPYAASATALTTSSAFTFDGTTLTTPGQIAFPATQAPSSGVNTLDDYEEGTWTPTIIGVGGQSGQTYGTQNGIYVKVGKLVHIHGRITLTALGTVTTQAAIGSLPFTPDATQYSVVHIGYFNNMTSNISYIAGIIAGGTARAELNRTTAAATGMSALVQADMSNTTDLIFAGTYVATA